MKKPTKIQRPILGAALARRMFPNLPGKWGELNLNTEAGFRLDSRDALNPLLDPATCADWVSKVLHVGHALDYSWGGYMEDRSVLWRGSYLTPEISFHLGIDYNVPVLTEVALPVAAELIYAKHHKDQKFGWGGQLFFRREHGLYFIMGHLKDFVDVVGKIYDQGQTIGKIAPSDCNGGWYPHLHLQCTRHFVPNIDGYGRADGGKLCPDPVTLLSS